MDSRTYYYARVSSKEQHLDRQISAFKAFSNFFYVKKWRGKFYDPPCGYLFVFVKISRGRPMLLNRCGTQSFIFDP